MQNYIYLTRESALSAPFGAFELQTCGQCGFSFNSKFNPAILCYDKNYDNSVTSRVMVSYYRKITSYLYKKYKLKDRLIVDIGCGKGIFLRIFAEMFPEVNCLGIDPSYIGETSPCKNLTFICDVFKKEYITTPPGLIVCRHVIEHIPSPVDFLISICDGLQNFSETPCFFEVPDLWWILKNKAFWDFCYEHCNYFTPNNFSYALNKSGFDVTLTQTRFGRQYIWAEALARNNTTPVSNNTKELLRAIELYNKDENNIINRAKLSVEVAKKNGSQVAVWGMATKGILFTYLLDHFRKDIDYCIDMSISKQGCFIPLTDHQISAPSILQTVKGSLSVIIMNPNYVTEIKEALSELKVPIAFIDTFGKIL